MCLHYLYLYITLTDHYLYMYLYTTLTDHYLYLYTTLTDHYLHRCQWVNTLLLSFAVIFK